MTYYFETYGCQMNIAESASIENIFINDGWQKAKNASECDVAIINSCSIRSSAENRIRGRLGYFLGQKRIRGGLPILIFTGCMAQELKNEIKNDFPFIDYTVGNFEKHKFNDLIKKIECDSLNNQNNAFNCNAVLNSENKNMLLNSFDKDKDEYQFFKTSYEVGLKSQFVPIMHGCNNFCTYCIVPYLRGREVSRDIDDILAEFDFLGEHDIKEVTLLGQNVNSYNFNGVNFANLLTKICAHLKNTNSPIKWVRFLSSHPKDLGDDLIDVLKTEPLIAPALHLPVQSGSTKVLFDMHRCYTRESYLSLVKKIRDAIPNISLTTDIMVGFPTETDNDFNETISLMDCVKYTSAMMYFYNERPGTVAAKMTQIPLDERKKRLEKIIALQLLHTQSQMALHLGEVVDVLVEKISKDNKNELLGKTPFDTKVAFKGAGNLIGKFVKVKLATLNGNTYNGSIDECVQ